ncbi:MAG: hypothetical protein BZY75_06405 [SAR202 cluster bacterium Io17-Chloro-G7]|nr:MAG: hypothetical protein BZY75_06405 [SAR202 cluster bacterium Io17-Chloro-G7]
MTFSDISVVSSKAIFGDQGKCGSRDRPFGSLGVDMAVVDDSTLANGPSVFIAYDGCGEIHILSSTDGGDSFALAKVTAAEAKLALDCVTHPRRAASCGGSIGDDVAIAAPDESTVLVTSRDNGGFAPKELFLSKSIDGGATFTTTVVDDALPLDPPLPFCD